MLSESNARLSRIERELRLWRTLFLAIVVSLAFISASQRNQRSDAELGAQKTPIALGEGKIADPQIRDCVTAGKGSPGIICLRSEDGKKSAVLTPTELNFFVNGQGVIVVSPEAGLIISGANTFVGVTRDAILLAGHQPERRAMLGVQGNDASLLLQGENLSTMLTGEDNNPKLVSSPHQGRQSPSAILSEFRRRPRPSPYLSLVAGTALPHARPGRTPSPNASLGPSAANCSTA